MLAMLALQGMQAEVEVRMMGGMGTLGMILGVLICVLVIVALVLLIIFLIKAIRK
ncbi:MAG: hypothetical protein VST67_13395 [Nitrospirota bacterium]|nr:hypothetical protein [Nitrospirota bacterium]